MELPGTFFAFPAQWEEEELFAVQREGYLEVFDQKTLRGAMLQRPLRLQNSWPSPIASPPIQAFERLWIPQTYLWLRSAAEDWDKFPANTKGGVRCPAKARQRRSELPPPPPPPGSGSQAAGACDAIPEGGHWGTGKEGGVWEEPSWRT